MRLLAVALGANKRRHMTRIPPYHHGKSMNHARPITMSGAKRRRATAIGRVFLRKATGPVWMPHDSMTVVCGETTYLCVSPLAWPVACGGLLPSLIPCLSSLFCKRSHVFAGSNEAPDILLLNILARSSLRTVCRTAASEKESKNILWQEHESLGYSCQTAITQRFIAGKRVRQRR